MSRHFRISCEGGQGSALGMREGGPTAAGWVLGIIQVNNRIMARAVVRAEERGYSRDIIRLVISGWGFLGEGVGGLDLSCRRRNVCVGAV